jgi:hypothetical protein
MTPEQFTYWLQGFVEISGQKEMKSPTDVQWEIIQSHLKTVFHKVTPNYQPVQPVSMPNKDTQPFDPFYGSGRVIC